MKIKLDKDTIYEGPATVNIDELDWGYSIYINMPKQEYKIWRYKTKEYAEMVFTNINNKINTGRTVDMTQYDERYYYIRQLEIHKGLLRDILTKPSEDGTYITIDRSQWIDFQEKKINEFKEILKKEFGYDRSL